jgi:hypothetical protein
MKVWLSITQHFDETEMVKTAIEHAGGVHGGTQDKTILTRTLTNTLSTGRFLLVLDDVWSDKAWSHVLSDPIRKASQKQPGSWVLITTRFGDLALQMGASFYQHQVNPLDVEDAWSLLKKQLPPDQVSLFRLYLVSYMLVLLVLHAPASTTTRNHSLNATKKCSYFILIATKIRASLTCI